MDEPITCSHAGCDVAARWRCHCSKCRGSGGASCACHDHRAAVAQGHAKAHSWVPRWRAEAANAPREFAAENVRSLAEGILGRLRTLHGQYPYHPPILFCERAVAAAQALSLTSYSWQPVGPRPNLRAPAVEEEMLDVAWVELCEKACADVRSAGGPPAAVRATVDALAELGALWHAGHDAVRRHREEG